MMPDETKLQNVLSAATGDMVSKFTRYRERRETIVHLLLEEKADDEWIKAVTKVFGEQVVAAMLGDLPQVSGVAAAPPGRTGTRRTKKGRMTWTAFILDQLAKAAGGRMTYDEVREAAKGTELEAALDGAQKGFHSAIGKLADRSELVRLNGWLFTPAAFAKYSEAVENGAAAVMRAPGCSRGSPLSDAIMSFIQSNPDGVTGKQIVEHVGGMEQFREATARGTSGVYNVLARVVRRGDVSKVDGVYRPVQNKGGSQ